MHMGMAMIVIAFEADIVLTFLGIWIGCIASRYIFVALFADELKHVEHYVYIEMVCLPDMTIEYDVEATDFILPVLSV